MQTKILFCGQNVTLSCDGKCDQAWGNNYHGQKSGIAPINPGTYEGGHGKPTDKKHNKWRSRECERAYLNER